MIDWYLRVHESKAFERASRGFTLMEMLIVLAIASILLALAVPNLRDYVANTRISTTTNELVATINMARTEAIKRGTSVFMCKSSDVDPAAPVDASCDANLTDHWHDGWLLYAAPSSNVPIDFITGAGAPTDTTPLIRAKTTIDSGVTVSSNGAGSGHLHFDQRGFFRNNNMAVLAVCDDRGEEFGRIIEISRLGHTTVHKTVAANPARTCTPG